MSRRASLYKSQNPGKKRVKFPDEVEFDAEVKDGDVQGMYNMLRRGSIQVDVNHISISGMAALHTAVIEGNFGAVRLLLKFGSDVNMPDEDTWTALHAACSEGFVDIARYLIKRGAKLGALTDQAERPIDLVDSSNFEMIGMMLQAHRDQHLLPSADDESDEEEAKVLDQKEDRAWDDHDISTESSSARGSDSS